MSRLAKTINGVWYTDIIDRLPKSGPFENILIIVDGCLKLAFLEPLSTLLSEAIINKLYKAIIRNGFLQSIAHDNSSFYTSDLFREVLFNYEIRDVRISPHNSSVNASEHFIGVYKQAARIDCNDLTNTWSKHFLNIKLALNSSPSTEQSTQLLIWFRGTM